MANESSPLQFEDIPLDEARRMGRGPRMEPMLYQTLRQKIQALSTEAVRIHLGPEITPARMGRYVRAIARQLEIPVAIRRLPGGVVFWRASEEDLREAEALAERFRREPPPPVAAPRRRGRPRRAS
jgi:hypothetical protein